MTLAAGHRIEVVGQEDRRVSMDRAPSCEDCAHLDLSARHALGVGGQEHYVGACTRKTKTGALVHRGHAILFAEWCREDGKFMPRKAGDA